MNSVCKKLSCDRVMATQKTRLGTQETSLLQPPTHRVHLVTTQACLMMITRVAMTTTQLLTQPTPYSCVPPTWSVTASYHPGRVTSTPVLLLSRCSQALPE